MKLPIEHLPIAEMLLALVALAPPLIIMALGFFPRKASSAAGIQVGDPKGFADESAALSPALKPILHLTRTAPIHDLRGLAVGLRHFPMEQCAVALRHLARSHDPEVSLYAQNISQQLVEELQARFSCLHTHPGRGDPRVAASLIETGLRVAISPVQTNGESARSLDSLAKLAAECLASCDQSPRLVAACAKVFLAAQLPDLAAETAAMLPADSPLRKGIQRAVDFAIHSRQCGAAT